jgi:type IV secretory pathway VirB3-like protein
MITLGLILLLIGFLTGIAVLWSLGFIILVVGLVLWLLGSIGHEIGGRRHYY